MSVCRCHFATLVLLLPSNFVRHLSRSGDLHLVHMHKLVVDSCSASHGNEVLAMFSGHTNVDLVNLMLLCF